MPMEDLWKFLNMRAMAMHLPQHKGPRRLGRSFLRQVNTNDPICFIAFPQMMAPGMHHRQ
jgi:hypothetical protein